MSPKCLMTASSLAHLAHFHEPYIKAFQDLGWEVHAAGAGPERETLHADELFCTGFEKSFFSLSNFAAAAQLRRLMRKNDYDLIICHTSLAAFFTRLAAYGVKGRSKIINVMHGYLFDDATPFHKAFILKAAERLVAPVTDMVITMNAWDYEWAGRHRAGGKVCYIPGMGMDENRIAAANETYDLGFGPEDFVLVYPAEFSERKNQAMLIRAMCHLPENVKLILPGDGALLNQCKAIAGELSLTNRVIFPGYVNNIFGVLKQADAAVSSSRSEGLPFNILEAMFSGLPVIASDVKGNADLVQDGINGFTYAYDDEMAFASCVRKLMEDEKLTQEMAEAGKRIAARYGLSVVQPQLMEMYLSALQ